ncbi:MalM family protein [Vibrio cincinnatiensis]|uniref:MalM family protein n=1 Tax=Vibrio cincinnatiensis TaxID=675 RepID=UPI001EDF2845|nr:MalM family protein [Vibrio cincinnatiensis]
MKKIWLVALSMTGLIGCSAHYEGVSYDNNLLTQAIVCCDTLEDAPWVVLELNENLKFDLENDSPVWEFNTGKSYFSALKFSERSGKVSLKIRSLMLDGRVIQPSIDLLDKNYQIVETITTKQFDIRFSDALAKTRYEINREVDTKLTPYLVIYGDMRSLGEKVIIPHPAKLRAQESGDPLPIVTDPIYRVSSVGTIEIQVETLTIIGNSSYKPSNIENKTLNVQPDTEKYYYLNIKHALIERDISKALSLLDEAKALGIDGAKEVFIKEINKLY